MIQKPVALCPTKKKKQRLALCLLYHTAQPTLCNSSYQEALKRGVYHKMQQGMYTQAEKRRGGRRGLQSVAPEFEQKRMTVKRVFVCICVSVRAYVYVSVCVCLSVLVFVYVCVVVWVWVGACVRVCGVCLMGANGF